uniref:DUF6598 domain-containing protein n=1 Tax=Oryza sativa subsp. japonica TaxID=39947 RepID=Q6K8U0_ORYSJ|nr:hypothetical protein [Oryza sativa Japonica Group]
MEDGVELDQDLAATREEAEREILNTWIWDKEIDLLQREIEEQDELSRLRHEQEREDDLYVCRMIEERHGEPCHLEDHELEKIYGPHTYETDYDSDGSGVSFYSNGRNIFMKYGDGFRYEDGNPYYAADREETWEKQILRQMKFPIPDLSESWEGSLVVEGPFNLDPNLTLTDHLMPALPKWERRWLDRDGKEPCRRAIQVLDLCTFAFRDTRNSQLRNYVFDYSRENPCKLKPGAHCLQPLMTPPRGIYAVGIVLIEYRLIIKGQKEEEDQVLIDGYSIYAPSFYADFEKLIWHINTGHFGTIDLTIFAIPKAVLVDLEFELGVGKLPPLTLSARHDKHFPITVYKYYNHSGCHPDGVIRNCRFGTEYDFDDFLCESLSFTPQKYGKSSKILARNLDGIQMAMKSTWSIMCEPCL